MEIASPHSAQSLNLPGVGLHHRHHHHHNLDGNHARFPSPAGPRAAVSMHSQGSVQSLQSAPSSRSSDATTATSASVLFSPPPPTSSHGGAFIANGLADAATATADVKPNNHVMNSLADASSSLFQICVALRQRLHGVRGFSDSLTEEEEEADEDTDPVTLLWRTFRRGYPLMLLYNALRPDTPLSIPQGVKEEKRAKAATFKFIQACNQDLKIPQDELFIVTDLYGDDTTGFVKVARVVNRVLDALVQLGVVEDVLPSASDFEQAEKGMKRTQRQHIVSELVKTERTYVQHLELLQAFKHLVEEKGVIHGDAVHNIFLNLNALLDFQRRFLIRVEQTNAMPEEEQNWGKLFLLYCEAFKVYEPYIANQKKCERTVTAEFPKLREAGGSLEMRQMVESPTSLCAFLMKPFQRLTKYPLLLDQLFKKGDLDEERKQDLVHGMEAAQAILSRTNSAVDKEEKIEAVQELKQRVEDWKGHRVDGFGELLLYGTFTVLKSDNLAIGKDAERQYHVYLFESILLCCKNIDINKPKNKLSNRNLVDSRGKPKYQLKGRIFMQNVTDLVSLAKPGSYTCQIFWKGDPSIENFIIRFTTEEAMRKWAYQIETQRRKHRERASTRQSDVSRLGSTSLTEFTYMQNQVGLENPYHEEDDEEEEGATADAAAAAAAATTHYSSMSGVNAPHMSSFSQSRNGSSTSLRSRSTTSESTVSVQSLRQPPPRLPSGAVPQQPLLSLRTRELQQPMPSPGSERSAESYFSPVGETPQSTRTSASSGMYPFPRQAMPPTAYYEEGHGSSRFTAPAVARPPASGPHNTYGPSSRGPGGGGRPGYPAGAVAMHSSVQMPGPRNRSVSSPDIHNGRSPIARSGSQPPVPEMPVVFQNSNKIQSITPSPVSAAGRASSSSQLHSDPRQHLDMSPAEYGLAESHGLAHPSSRTTTPVAAGQNLSSPSPSDPFSPSTTTPAQLKVKVHCPAASQTLTLVVSMGISYQTLKDRIDAKLQRSTNLTLQDRRPSDAAAKLPVKLKYLDEDDYVSIQSDEDVQTAFETWREQGVESIGGMGEIELFCQR